MDPAVHRATQLPHLTTAPNWTICLQQALRPTQLLTTRNRYKGVPGRPSGQLRLPPVLTGLAARLRHSASRAAVRRHRPEPGIGGVKALSGQPDGRRPKSPCSTARLVSSRGASAGAGLRHGAILRLSGAAHQRGSAGLTSSARRTGPGRRLCCQRPRGHGPAARLLGVDRTARTASSTGLLANAATVTGGNSPPGEPGGDQVAKVTEPMRRVFAQVTGWPAPGSQRRASSPQLGNIRSEHTYGGPPSRRCCTFLLYRLFD